MLARLPQHTRQFVVLCLFAIVAWHKFIRPQDLPIRSLHSSSAVDESQGTTILNSFQKCSIWALLLIVVTPSLLIFFFPHLCYFSLTQVAFHAESGRLYCSHDFAENQPVDDIEQNECGGKYHSGHPVDADRPLPPLLHDLLRLLLVPSSDSRSVTPFCRESRLMFFATDATMLWT